MEIAKKDLSAVAPKFFLYLAMRHPLGVRLWSLDNLSLRENDYLTDNLRE